MLKRKTRDVERITGEHLSETLHTKERKADTQPRNVVHSLQKGYTEAPGYETTAFVDPQMDQHFSPE